MNINQHIDFMQAAANPFPLAASFHQVEGGGYKCKMCGAAVKDQGACADHLLSKHREMEAREFSEKRRKKLAKSGDAMPGGGFPIVNKEDLGNAKQAIGRAKNPAAARRHINERAKELGAKPIGAGMAAGGPGSGRHPGYGCLHCQEKFGNKQGMLKHAIDTGHKHYTGPGYGSYVIRPKDHEKLKTKWGLKAQVEFSPAMRLRMPKKAGEGTTTQSPQYTGGQPELQAGGPGSGRRCEYCGAKTEYTTCGDSCRRALNEKMSKGNFANNAEMREKLNKGNYFPKPGKKEMDAMGFRRKMNAPGGKCSTHGFHRGSGYEGKAHSMGHRLPLSAAADKPEIRQRPARPVGRPRRASYNFRGEQQLI